MTRLFAALLALLIAQPVAAQTVTYVCTFGGNGSGWIGPQVQVVHDMAARRAVVIDGLIASVHGGPMPARVTRNRASGVGFSWNLIGVRNSAGQLSPRLAYTLSIDRTNGSAVGRMRPSGYRNAFSSRGRCAADG